MIMRLFGAFGIEYDVRVSGMSRKYDSSSHHLLYTANMALPSSVVPGTVNTDQVSSNHDSLCFPSGSSASSAPMAGVPPAKKYKVCAVGAPSSPPGVFVVSPSSGLFPRFPVFPRPLFVFPLPWPVPACPSPCLPVSFGGPTTHQKKVNLR